LLALREGPQSLIHSAIAAGVREGREGGRAGVRSTIAKAREEDWIRRGVKSPKIGLMAYIHTCPILDFVYTDSISFFLFSSLKANAT